MGMLGALLRGAAGPGLLDMGARMDRRDELEQAAQARRAATEEERAFRAEQARLDRESREEVAGIRKGGGKRSSSGGGDGDGGGDDNYAVAAIMEKYGVSEAKARQMLEASRQDQNPFPDAQRTVTTERVDDGHRTLAQPRTESAPDMARWSELNRTIAKAMREGPSMARSNIEMVRNAEGQEQRNTITGGMLGGKLTPAQTAEAVAATKGDGAFGKGGVNQFDGTPDAVGKSTIAENNAQAGSAGRANRDAMDGMKLPPAVKAEITNLDKRESELAGAITKAQADDTWNPAQSPGQKQLQANLAAIRLRRSQLIAPYLDGGKPRDADPLGLMGDAPKAKPSQSDVRKSEPKEPAKAEKRTPSMLDRVSMAIGDVVDAAKKNAGTPEAIRARVAEAKAGGDPLTPGEIQLARKYGIAV